MELMGSLSTSQALSAPQVTIKTYARKAKRRLATSDESGQASGSRPTPASVPPRSPLNDLIVDLCNEDEDKQLPRVRERDLVVFHPRLLTAKVLQRAGRRR
jgi:hypothetical protein